VPKTPKPTSRTPTYTVTSEYFNFDTELSYWKQVAPKLIVNNVYVNVHTQDWTNVPQQRAIPLPPLTEHSMISVRTNSKFFGSSVVIIIVGGFSSYLSDGITPDFQSYNTNIYFSYHNGGLWYVRGFHSRAWDTPIGYNQADSGRNWLPRRSAAAVFAYEQKSQGRTLLFIHGGRFFDGVGWANGGAQDDISFFDVESCTDIVLRNDGMWAFQWNSGTCNNLITVNTYPLVPRYFHSVIVVPVAGVDYFVFIGGFAPTAISALQSVMHHPSGGAGAARRFSFFYCSAHELNVVAADALKLNLALFEFPWDYITPLSTTSALFAAYYNQNMDVIFMFGGVNMDFTRLNSTKDFHLHNTLCIFKFDPSNTNNSFLKELMTIGKLPSKRAASTLISNSHQVMILGGADASLTYRPDLFAVSITSAHPNYTKVFGDVMDGGIVGITKNVFVSAQTILQQPAFSCESCFTASARGLSDKAPTYNLVFIASGIDQGAALYHGSFVPVVSGKYVIHVATLQSSVANGTPFVQEIEILPGVTCASTSRLAYSETVIAGSTMNFVVTCFDAFQNSRPGGDSIIATVNRMQTHVSTDGAIMVTTSDEFSYEYTDLKSGSHSLDLSLTRSSVYNIASRLGMQLIRAEVLTFTVQPQPALCEPSPGICNTLVIGDLNSTLAGQAKSM
jgi:hypothetical protein